MAECRQSKAHQLDRGAKEPVDERSVGLRCLDLPVLKKLNQELAGEAASTLVKHHAVTKARLLAGDSASGTENNVRGFRSRASD